MIGEKRFNCRERLLRALESDTSDYVPCSFMILKAVYEKCREEISNSPYLRWARLNYISYKI